MLNSILAIITNVMPLSPTIYAWRLSMAITANWNTKAGAADMSVLNLPLMRYNAYQFV